MNKIEGLNSNKIDLYCQGFSAKSALWSGRAVSILTSAAAITSVLVLAALCWSAIVGFMGAVSFSHIVTSFTTLPTAAKVAIAALPILLYTVLELKKNVPDESEAAVLIKAQEAIEAFKIGAADRKKSLAQDMLLVEEKIATISTDRARELRNEIHQQLRTVFATPIAEEIMKQANKTAIGLLARMNRWDLARCSFSEDWIALFQEMDAVSCALQKAKAATIESANKQNIFLDPSNLCCVRDDLFYKKKPAKIQTELSVVYEKVGTQLRDLQTKFSVKHLEFIEKNYQEQEMGGDGDCLFRSLAGAMNQDPNATHLDVRKSVVEHIQRSLNDYKLLIENELSATRGLDRITDEHIQDYLRSMSRQGTWGTGVEIQAFSDMQKRPIIVLMEGADQEGDRLSIFHPKKGASLCPIVIKNILLNSSEENVHLLQAVHYRAMMPKDSGIFFAAKRFFKLFNYISL